MKKYTQIPTKTLHDLLRYEADTGLLFWKSRPNGTPQWNGRFAGKEAFTSEYPGGYKHGDIFGLRVRAHRVIWAMHNGMWPDGEIDHINGNPRDNRIENLREVDRTGQNRNHKLQSNNKSGRVGVYWHSRGQKWTAQIRANGKVYHLGLFASISEAVAARSAAEKVAGYHPNHGEKR
jgi:hypothetical protein